MKADAINLVQYLEQSDTQFIVPVYQRNYDWKEENCKQLFNDIVNIHLHSKANHFIGSIVDISKSDVQMVSKKEFLIIDGQQRITTSILLLKAIFDLSTDNIIKEIINERYLINKHARNDEDRIKLKPVARDNITFTKLINNDLENIDTSSNIYINYDHFKKLITKSIEDSKFTISQLYTAFERLWIVCVRLKHNEDDPQLIFESINSTGKALQSSDLIRNYILMGKENKEQEIYYTNYWLHIEKNLANNNEQISNFFYHYLIMKKRASFTKPMLYEIFKEYTNEKDTKELLEDILSFSKIYKKILVPSTDEQDYKYPASISGALINLQDLKITVVNPYIMEILNLFRSQIINKETVVSILEIIQSYIVRRIITDKGTKSLNKIFSVLQKDIESTKGYNQSRYLDFFSFVLANLKGGSSFPKDSEFRGDFIYKNIYALKINKYLLGMLENHDNKEPVNIDPVTIEHIMPQTLTKEWKNDLGDEWQRIHDTYLDTIGNLTLTGYNSELSNNTFNERKQDIFKKSKLSLNEYLKTIDNWGEDNINTRALQIIDNIALKIWKYPKVCQDIQESFEETYSINDDVDITGKNPTKLSFFEDEEISSWRELLSQFFNQLRLNKSDKFELLLNETVKSNISKIISCDKNNFRNSIEISPNIFIEINLSASHIIKNIRTIYNYLNLDDEDIEFSYTIKVK